MFFSLLNDSFSCPVKYAAIVGFVMRRNPRFEPVVGASPGGRHAGAEHVYPRHTLFLNLERQSKSHGLTALINRAHGMSVRLCRDLLTNYPCQIEPCQA